MEKIPFSPPRIDAEIIRSVTEALASGWITTGPKTKTLEVKLAEFSGAKKVFCLNSCTIGLELMLKWFGVGPGDEVILPAYTYCATANVVLHLGAKPVMVDICSSDMCIDPQEIAKAITHKTKAIMPVDLGGLPCDYAAIFEVLKAHNDLFQATNDQQSLLGRPLVLCDAAHSVGAISKGKAAAIGVDVAVYSFHAVKNLTTAEGGAVCLNLPEGFDCEAIYKGLNRTSLHGQSKDALAKFGTNAWEYDVTEAGYKCNMPDVLAAIGLVEIDRYASTTLPKRRAVFKVYDEVLGGHPQVHLPIYEDENRTSSYHLYLLRLKGISLAQRNELIQRLFEIGISTNVHYKPLPLLSLYKGLGYDIEDYPVSKACFEQEITLPVYYDLSLASAKKVATSVLECLDKIKS